MQSSGTAQDLVSIFLRRVRLFHAVSGVTKHIVVVLGTIDFGLRKSNPIVLSPEDTGHSTQLVT